MTIETTPEHKAEIDTRRKLGNLTIALQSIIADVEAVLTSANGMKRNLATAALTLAEIEALYISQTHAKRDVDGKLHEATTRLADMVETAKLSTTNALADLKTNSERIDNLCTQADRITHEPFILDIETGVVENVEYVDIEWLADQLQVSEKQVRRYIGYGKLPSFRAYAAAQGGRPRQMWLKSEAINAVAQLRGASNTHPNKKGIAALV